MTDSGGHDWFEDFNRSACEGTHPKYDLKCPKKVEGAVDRCGVCGCTLVGLDLTNSPPSNCIRREAHRTAADGGAPAPSAYLDRESPVDRFLGDGGG